MMLLCAFVIYDVLLYYARNSIMVVVLNILRMSAS